MFSVDRRRPSSSKIMAFLIMNKSLPLIFGYVQMCRCADAQICRWADGQMGKWANGQMGKCADGQMGKWANGQMGKCADV